MIDAIALRPWIWMVRLLGMRTILALTLLLIALVSVALGLTDLIRGLEDGLLLPVVLVGVLLGWILAKSPLPGWLSGIVALVLGVEFIVVRVGKLEAPLGQLLQSLIEIAQDIVRWPLDRSIPDWSLISPALAELDSGLSSMLTRIGDWSEAMIRGQAAFDPVAVALAWSLAVYAAATWAAWSVRRRHQPLQAIVPAGVLLAISLSYSWDFPGYLQVLIGATLLLMIVTGQIARERRWEMRGIDFSPELRFDLALVAVPLLLVLVIAMVLVPNISVRAIARQANRLIVEHLDSGKQVADSMGLEEPGGGSGIARARAGAGGLPNQSLIGSGSELSEQVVMTVDTGEAAYAPPQADPSLAMPRYYWRALAYDVYTGRGWRTSKIEKSDYLAGRTVRQYPVCPDGECQSEATADITSHRLLQQNVQIVDDLGGLLYNAGELVTADQDFSVAWRSPTDAFGAEIEASAYQASSLIPNVSEFELRSSWIDYPDWVQERYLALPYTVPARVLNLALELTVNEPTPYDQARAIESYLRTFPYTLDLPAPPPNVDVVDYFLFDLQQGYCDYYATAMVVLARAAGLPARLIVGYASGNYEPFNGQYVVTASDAHAWAEVYFPGYGWIEFEPTGGRPPIERPAEPSPAVEIPELPAPEEEAPGSTIMVYQLFGLGLTASLLFVGLIGLTWRVIDGWRLRRLSPAAAMTTLYRRLHHHGRRLAVPTTMGDTPFEFQAELTERMTTLAQGRRLGKTAATAKRDLRWLTELFVRGLYSPRKPATDERATAIRTWRRLSRRLWLAWIWQRTSRRDELDTEGRET